MLNLPRRPTKKLLVVDKSTKKESSEMDRVAFPGDTCDGVALDAI
jgi:hypothetical protein